MPHLIAFVPQVCKADLAPAQPLQKLDLVVHVPRLPAKMDAQLLAGLLPPGAKGFYSDKCSTIMPSAPVCVHEHSGLWQLFVVVDDVLQIHVCLFGLWCRSVLWLWPDPRQQLIFRPPRLLEGKGKGDAVQSACAPAAGTDETIV